MARKTVSERIRTVLRRICLAFGCAGGGLFRRAAAALLADTTLTFRECWQALQRNDFPRRIRQGPAHGGLPMLLFLPLLTVGLAWGQTQTPAPLSETSRGGASKI